MEQRNVKGQFVVGYAGGPGRLTLAEHEAKRKAEIATAARKAAVIAEMEAIAAANEMVAARRPPPKKPEQQRADKLAGWGQARTATIVAAGTPGTDFSDKPVVHHHDPLNYPRR